jgi:cell division protein ZapB
MKIELDALEGKLEQLVQLSQRLRVENRQLRQELATALSQSSKMNDKMENARQRLENLLAQLPEDSE